ncbi:hypothetical protein [Slackia piriformis]|uniref:hypothetical protein n=1 Tax=Slackia piriformis TaxID=626934 RepID=UPI0039F5BEAD
MPDSFPIKLGVSPRCVRFENVAGQPAGRVFGYVSKGIDLTDGGSFYVVEFDPADRVRVRLIAYADKYGRMFSCDDVLVAPPARTPTLYLATYADSDHSTGVVFACDANGKDQVVGSYACKNPEEDGPYRMERYERPSLLDTAALDSWLEYADFLARLYLTFVTFADAVEAARPFDLGAVFARLNTADPFDAVNKEVLEAEASWGESLDSGVGIERFLVHELRDAGIMGKSAADFAVELEDGFESVPNVRMVRTKKYADTFYLDFSYLNAEGILVENGLLEALPEAREARESFLRTEAALNRFLLLVDYLESTDGGFLRATEGVCAQTDRWLIDRICLQAPDITKAPLLRSRWEKHVAFARAGESLRLPYRLGYEFCSSADGIRFGLDVSCPTASTMPSSAWSQETGLFLSASAADRNGAEARYAAHAAILMASLAFSVSSDVEEAYVNCLRGGVASDVVVSGCIRRARFEELLKREESDRSVKDPFAFLRECGVDFRFGEEFSLESVSSCFKRGEGVFGNTYEASIDRDFTPFSEAARDMTGVARPKDLGIFESRGRARYADELSEALDKGVPAALECLKGIHDRTEDIMLRRICLTLMEGFESGQLGEHSYLEVKEALVDPYGLKAPMARATAFLRADDEAHALEALNELLAKTKSLEGFADTAGTCYRYFDSYETRSCTRCIAGMIRKAVACCLFPTRCILSTMLSRRCIRCLFPRPIRRSTMRSGASSWRRPVRSRTFARPGRISFAANSSPRWTCAARRFGLHGRRRMPRCAGIGWASRSGNSNATTPQRRATRSART